MKPMHPVLFVIGIGWVVFWTGWLVAAFTAKASRGGWSRLLGLRLVLILVIAYFLRRDWHSGGHAAVSGAAVSS